MFQKLCRTLAVSCLLAAVSTEASAQDGAAPPSLLALESTALQADDQEAPSEKGKPAANSVFLEGLGAGLFYSINYERRVIDDLGIRAGFSYLSLSGSVAAGGQTATASASYLTIPVTASYLGIRGRRSGLELGGGMTLAYASAAASGGITSASDSGMSTLGTLMAGYRLHPVDGAGFQFRVGVMALAGKGLSLSDPDPESFGVLPWFYTSAGAAF